jgi:hypothetical protein
VAPTAPRPEPANYRAAGADALPGVVTAGEAPTSHRVRRPAHFRPLLTPTTVRHATRRRHETAAPGVLAAPAALSGRRLCSEHGHRGPRARLALRRDGHEVHRGDGLLGVPERSCVDVEVGTDAGLARGRRKVLVAELVDHIARGLDWRVVAHGGAVLVPDAALDQLHALEDVGGRHAGR